MLNVVQLAMELVRGHNRGDGSLPPQPQGTSDPARLQRELRGIQAFLSGVVSDHFDELRTTASPKTALIRRDSRAATKTSQYQPVNTLGLSFVPQDLDVGDGSGPIGVFLRDVRNLVGQTIEACQPELLDSLRLRHGAAVARAATLLDQLPPSNGIKRFVISERDPRPGAFELEQYDLRPDKRGGWRESDECLVLRHVLDALEAQYMRAEVAVKKAAGAILREDPGIPHAEFMTVLGNSRGLVMQLASLNDTQLTALDPYLESAENYVYSSERQRVEYVHRLTEVEMSVPVDYLPADKRRALDFTLEDGRVTVPIRELTEDGRGIEDDDAGCPARFAIEAGGTSPINAHWDSYIDRLRGPLQMAFPQRRIETPKAIADFAAWKPGVAVAVEGVTRRGIAVRVVGTDRSPAIDGSPDDVHALHYEWDDAGNQLVITDGSDADLAYGPKGQVTLFLPAADIVRSHGTDDLEVMGARNVRARVDDGGLRAVCEDVRVAAMGDSTVQLVTTGLTEIDATRTASGTPSVLAVPVHTRTYVTTDGNAASRVSVTSGVNDSGPPSPVDQTAARHLVNTSSFAGSLPAAPELDGMIDDSAVYGSVVALGRRRRSPVRRVHGGEGSTFSRDVRGVYGPEYQPMAVPEASPERPPARRSTTGPSTLD